MDRRRFIQTALAGSLLASLGARDGCAPAAGGPIVDAHCHVFNASDIPIEGFLKNSVLRDLQDLAGPVIEFLDTQLELRAPGFDEENDRLERLLQRNGKSHIPEAARLPDGAFAQLVQYLRVERPGAYRKLGRDAGLSPGGDALDQLFRLLNWAFALTLPRYRVFQLLARTYPQVELFTPSMVDLAPWLHDTTNTGVWEQIVLYEKIARLCPGKFYPLAPFDPLREISTVERSLPMVKRAVEEMGFVGVKVYPVMGFRPFGNAAIDPSDPSLAQIDDALLELYAWCEAEDVPILTHGKDSLGAAEGYGERAHPMYWESVLEMFPGLRLNFGHFGGDRSFTRAPLESWGWEMGSLMERFEFVFADTSFHDVGLDASPGFSEAYFDRVEALYAAFPRARSRLMYGSDWHMIMMAKGFDNYAARFRDGVSARFPGNVENFMGANALEWLGLSGGDTGNRRRLEAFYGRNGLALPHWWAS